MLVAALLGAAPAQANHGTGDVQAYCYEGIDPHTCLAVSVRLDDLHGSLETLDASIQLLVLRIETLRGIIENEGGSDGVALNAETSNRLDLAWWGAWAIVGLLLSLLVAPMMAAAFRWWRE